MLGTRFLANTESPAHPHYKNKLLAANEGDTVRTILFGYGWPNAPHRTLRTAFIAMARPGGSRSGIQPLVITS